MEQKEIISKNRFIAEFMGGIYKSKLFPIGKSQIWLPYHNMTYINAIKYHTSWDWLIPVIDKIYSSNDYIKYKHKMSGQFEVEVFINPKFILNTWTNVIEFIKWYNLKNGIK